MEFTRDPVTQQYVASPLTDDQIDTILANYKMAAKCITKIMEETFPGTPVSSNEGTKFHQNVKIQHRAFKARKVIALRKTSKPYVVRKLVFDEPKSGADN